MEEKDMKVLSNSINERNSDYENDDSFDSSYEELTENISEYYKNAEEKAKKEVSKANDDTNDIHEEIKKRFFFSKLIKSKANVVGGTDASGEIRDSKYGLTDRKELFLYLLASLAVSLCIIGGSVAAALKMPRDEAVDNEYIDELRHSEDYVKLQKEYAGLSKEVNDLTEALKEKKETVEFIEDYDNKKAELTSKIDTLKQEINDITYNINQKQAEIAELDKIISDRAGTMITLSPGRYVVGSNIAAGKYSVTGAGKLSVASSSNKSKVNTVIGSSAYELTLEDGDIVNIEMSAKFTSVN